MDGLAKTLEAIVVSNVAAGRGGYRTGRWSLAQELITYINQQLKGPTSAYDVLLDIVIRCKQENLDE